MKLEVTNDRGSAMIISLLVGLILTTILVVSLNNSTHQVREAEDQLRSTTSFGAAEGAANDYVAKLVEDHEYYNHWVHPTEATRRSPTGVVRSAGQAWTGEATWTYPSGKNRWVARADGSYEVDLQITPPPLGTQSVKIIATGRKTSDAGDRRAVEMSVRPATIADFQMIANRNITYGSSATTYGKLYAGIDENGVAHNITHSGHAYANLYAEGTVSQTPTYHDNARSYTPNTSPAIRSAIKNPIVFNSFLSAINDIQAAAQVAGSGIYLDDASAHAWRLVFRANGTIAISKCSKTGGNAIALVAATCVAHSTPSMPANGAIYAAQSLIIGSTTEASVVDGRLTVASFRDIVIGNNITYEQPGDDVLGLIANDDMVIAKWCPYNLDWTAATLAQAMQWHSYSSDGSKGTMNFTGSTATNLGGYMTMFDVRNYYYDRNLLYLSPPRFPTLDDAYTTVLFREIGP